MNNFALRIREVLKNRSLIYSLIVFQILVVWDLLSVFYVVTLQDDVFFTNGYSNLEGFMAIFICGLVTIAINCVIFYLAFTRLRTTTTIIPIALGLIVFTYFSSSSFSTLLYEPGPIFFGLYSGLFYAFIFYAPALWVYYRFRNGYFAFGWLSVLYMTTLMVAEAWSIEIGDITALLRPDLLFISCIFYLLASLLMIFENNNALAKWKRRPELGIRHPKRAILPILLLIFFVTIMTNLISPKLWEVLWEEDETSGGGDDGYPEELEDGDLPQKAHDGTAGNLDKQGQETNINPNQELSDNIAGNNGKYGNPSILFSVQILATDYNDFETSDVLDDEVNTLKDVQLNDKPHYWKLENLESYNRKIGFHTTLDYTSERGDPLGYGPYEYSLLSDEFYDNALVQNQFQIFTFHDLTTPWIVGEHEFYEIRLLNGQPRHVYNLKNFSRITEKSKPWTRGDSYILRSTVKDLNRDIEYHAQLLRDSDTSQDMQHKRIPPIYSTFKDYRIRELAFEVTAGQTTRFDKAEAIENWFHTEFEYSLAPGSPSEINTTTEARDRLHYFLFENRKGYCLYFANGMVAMLRSLGIESRVAVGFSEGTYSPELDAYVVTSEEAHAWVEVYYPEYGWITYDPTSPRLSEEERERQMNVDKKIEKQIDQLKKEIDYTEKKKKELEKDLDTNNPYIYEDPEQTEFEKSMEEFLQKLESAIAFIIKYLLPLCCLLLFTILLTLPPVYNLYIETKLSRRSGSTDSRVLIVNRFKLLERRLWKFNRSWKRRPGESAIQLAERVIADCATPNDQGANIIATPPDDALRLIAQLYNRAVYRHELDGSEIESLDSSYSVLISWIDQVEPDWKRIVSFWLP